VGTALEQCDLARAASTTMSGCGQHSVGNPETARNAPKNIERALALRRLLRMSGVRQEDS